MPIRNHMTKSPLTIGRGQTLTVAHQLMRGRRVRHLPVLESGKLVGIVSQSDLHLIESLKDVDPDEVLVEEAMSEEIYAVPGKTPLDQVVRVMARRKIGSAVIVDGLTVIGVFTTMDALRILARLVKPRRRG